VGWEVEGGASAAPSNALHRGLGVTASLGEEWRRAAPMQLVAGQVPSPDVVPLREHLTFINAGLNWTNFYRAPSLTRVGMAIGPAWSSLSDRPTESVVVNSTTAFSPGPPLVQPDCGNGYMANPPRSVSTTAPTLMVVIGLERQAGAWGVYLSPRFGITAVTLPATCAFTSDSDIGDDQ
jgi:hypothetical protein